MSELLFLTSELVLELHREALVQCGGQEGIREPGLFEAAVYQPQNVYYYGQGDLFEVAGAYAFHIAQSQAFLDGNKRTGVLAALTFLRVNGVKVPGNSEELYEALIAIAGRRMGREELGELLRKLSH